MVLSLFRKYHLFFYILTLVEANQSIEHLLCHFLLGYVRNQMIFHNIQDHPFGLHFFLVVSCQLLRICRWSNWILDDILEIVFLQKQCCLGFPEQKIWSTIQSILEPEASLPSLFCTQTATLRLFKLDKLWYHVALPHPRWPLSYVFFNK